MAWKSSSACLRLHKKSISEGRGTQLPCLQESRYFPSRWQGARQRRSLSSPEGSLPHGLPWQCSHLPTALQSLRVLLLVQSFVPAHPRKLTVAAPNSSFPTYIFPPSRLMQQPAPPEGPPGQAHSMAWPSHCFTLPQVSDFSYLIHQSSSIH